MKDRQGPWQIARNRNGYAVSIIDASGATIAEMDLWLDEALVEANARLIAAAPDLLTACRAMLGAIEEGNPDPIDAGEFMRDVLASITGEEEA